MNNKWSKVILVTLVLLLFSVSAIACGSSYVSDEEAGASFFEEDGKYGIISLDGEIIVEARFDFTTGWFHDLAMDFIPEYESDFIYAFVWDYESDKWGIVTPQGIMIEPISDLAFSWYKKGLLQIGIDDREGIINREGELVLDIIYDRVGIEMYNDPVVVIAHLDDESAVFDENGSVLIPFGMVESIESLKFDDDGYAVICGIYGYSLLNWKTGEVYVDWQKKDIVCVEQGNEVSYYFRDDLETPIGLFYIDP